MGFRFRRSFKIGPGIRLNVSKSGVSTSIGTRGATVNVGPRGTRGTVGIPGTGMSYSEKLTSADEHQSGAADVKSASMPWVLLLLIGALLLLWFAR